MVLRWCSVSETSLEKKTTTAVDFGWPPNGILFHPTAAPVKNPRVVASGSEDDSARIHTAHSMQCMLIAKLYNHRHHTLITRGQTMHGRGSGLEGCLRRSMLVLAWVGEIVSALTHSSPST